MGDHPHSERPPGGPSSGARCRSGKGSRAARSDPKGCSYIKGRERTPKSTHPFLLPPDICPRGTFARPPEEERMLKLLRPLLQSSRKPFEHPSLHLQRNSPQLVDAATLWGIDCLNCKPVQGPFCVSVSPPCLPQLTAERFYAELERVGRPCAPGSWGPA